MQWEMGNGPNAVQSQMKREGIHLNPFSLRSIQSFVGLYVCRVVAMCNMVRLHG